MIGLAIVVAVFVGIAAIGYLLDRRRRPSLTPEEEADEAVWLAQHQNMPDSHDVYLPPQAPGGPFT
jgi:hypothetical protein